MGGEVTNAEVRGCIRNRIVPKPYSLVVNDKRSMSEFTLLIKEKSTRMTYYFRRDSEVWIWWTLNYPM